MSTLVLMYHRIGQGVAPGREMGEAAYAVARDRFRGQLELLRASGCPVVPLGTVDKGRRAVTVTFDDGNASDHSEALPLLREHGLTASFFISPALIGRSGYLSWEQVAELGAAGMQVGAHGLDHTLLSTLADGALRDHLGAAFALLTARLGHPPEALSLPGGAGGPRAVAIARQVGFRLIADSVPRLHRGDPATTTIPRFAVRGHDGPAHLRALVERRPQALFLAQARYRALTLLRSALGEGVYRRVRRVWAGEPAP